MKITPQNYPRIDDPYRKDNGLLDVTTLVPHNKKIAHEKMVQIIQDAIQRANQKSSRDIMSISEDAAESEKQAIYQKTGQKLFHYFKKSYSDPATMAHQVHTKHYRAVGIEQFRNWIMQKGAWFRIWEMSFTICSRDFLIAPRVCDSEIAATTVKFVKMI